MYLSMDTSPHARLWSKLSALRQRLFAGMQGGFSALAALELTVPQAMALFRLVERGPLSIAELQEVTGRSQAATSHLVAQLQRRGLVTRKDDDADRRRTLVSATARAGKLAGEVEGLRLRGFEDLLAPVPVTAVRRLERALDEVLSALEAPR
jgi:DNA-binding MarR family transcriptional regulator